MNVETKQGCGGTYQPLKKIDQYVSGVTEKDLWPLKATIATASSNLQKIPLNSFLVECVNPLSSLNSLLSCKLQFTEL